jgi:hypothetical protein
LGVESQSAREITSEGRAPVIAEARWVDSEAAFGWKIAVEPQAVDAAFNWKGSGYQVGDTIRLGPFLGRAGTRTLWPWGDVGINSNGADQDRVHFVTLATGECNRRMLAVGTMPPNPFGLCDMKGNVAERCDEWATKVLARLRARVGSGAETRRSARRRRGGS